MRLPKQAEPILRKNIKVRALTKKVVPSVNVFPSEFPLPSPWDNCERYCHVKCEHFPYPNREECYNICRATCFR